MSLYNKDIIVDGEISRSIDLSMFILPDRLATWATASIIGRREHISTMANLHSQCGRAAGECQAVSAELDMWMACARLYGIRRKPQSLPQPVLVLALAGHIYGG